MDVISYSPIDILISIVLASIMFGIGLSLSTNSFRNILKFPKAFIIGLASQMIGLPIIAYFIAINSGLPDAMKVGLIILAACPGGTTSGFVTYLFKGNVALSVSLTSVNSFLTIFTIPFVVNLALKIFLGSETQIYLPFWSSVMQILLITVIPVMLAIGLRSIYSNFAEKIEKVISKVLIGLLALVYLIKFFASQQNGGTGITTHEVFMLLPYAFIFNTVCAIYGMLICRKLFKFSVRDSFTVAIEVTLHNTTLALLIAGTLLKNQDMVKPALIYSLFSFWAAIIFGFIVKWIYKTKPFKAFTN